MKNPARGHRRALVIFLVLSGVLVPTRMLTTVAASSSPEVYVNPAITVVQSVNNTFTIQVKVANMNAFNTYDVEVTSDPTVINATDLSTFGNIYTNATGGVPTTVIHCINGQGQSCAPTKGDGPGVVHSVMTLLGGTTSGNGLLFNVTYKVVSTKPYSTLAVQNATTIIANAGHSIDHSTIGGQYGTAPPPDFSLAASPQSLILLLDSSNQTTITLTSSNSFVGKVNLTAPSPGPGITLSFSRNQTLLRADGGNSTILTVNAAQTASPTSYTIVVIATSGSLSHSLFVQMKVQGKPDFQPGVSPSDLRTHQSSSNSTVITVTSLYGFSGIVKLRIDAPSSTTAVFHQTNNSTNVFLVPRDGSVNDTVAITTQASPISFRDLFNVTGISGSITHVITFVAEPPQPDFNVSLTTAFATIQPGGTTSVTIAVTSVDYFFGPVYMLGATQTGLSFTFSPANFYLDLEKTVSSTLRVTTNSTTTAGNHTLTLIVFGIRQTTGVTTSHTVQLTFAVSAAPVTPVSNLKTFLGLQAWQFYTIIVSLIMILGVLGVIESRRSKRSQRRAILEA